MGGTSDAKAADPTTPVELVDALNGVFGKQPHTRGSHAKGFCVSGKFTPAADAASLSKAPQFSKSVPLLGRFSMGGGNPKAADNSKGERGLALRFDLGDGAASDFVLLSVPVFIAKTPAQVVEFLKVRTPPEGADKPAPAAIEAFSKANPETTRQAAWVKEHALPAGYAGTTYFGIHAFTLTNAAGEKKLVKLKAIPSDGEKGLSDDEAKAKGTDFYEADFKERLANGPPSSSSSRSSARRATRQAIPRCDGTARTRGLPHRSAPSRSTQSRPTGHAIRSPSCRPICRRGSQGLRMIRSSPRAPALMSCRSPAARNHRTESRRPSRHGRAKPRHDEFSAIWEAPASRPSALTGRRPDDISCRIALALRSWECQDGLASRRRKSMKFKPLHDRVVVQRLEEEQKTKGGIIIPDTAAEKPQTGKVIAVGPGARGEDGKLQPMGVKAGDKVLFGKWSGTEVKIDGEELLIMKESDIMGILS